MLYFSREPIDSAVWIFRGRLRFLAKSKNSQRNLARTDLGFLRPKKFLSEPLVKKGQRNFLKSHSGHCSAMTSGARPPKPLDHVFGSKFFLDSAEKYVGKDVPAIYIP